MNSIILKNIENDICLLDEQASLHLHSIVKVKVGDRLKATILNQSLAICEVIECAKRIKVKVVSKHPGLHFPIQLIVGASRPPTMKKVIEHGSSLGVSQFDIQQCLLSEKSYLQSKIYTPVEFEKLSNLGLSQSAVFFKTPKINKHYSPIKEFSSKQRFILSPYAKKHLKDVEIDINQPSVFAIGPERGWSESELLHFESQGFEQVKISPSILRVEIASLSLLGYLNQLM